MRLFDHRYQRSVRDVGTPWDTATQGPILTFYVHDLVKIEVSDQLPYTRTRAGVRSIVDIACSLHGSMGSVGGWCRPLRYSNGVGATR
jgi:hypothetical protein